MNILEYIAEHLFGAKTATLFEGGLHGAVAAIIASQPGINLAAVKVLANAQLSNILDKVLMLANVPTWAEAIVKPALLSCADALIAKVYAELTVVKS